MCAIAGVTAPDKGLVERMNALMAHRGPDDTGVFFDHQVALGHNRLSIIDLTPGGHQPMAAGELQITFNGEIYNYRELREGLKKAGEQFVSESDTEVIVRGYAREGVAFFNKLRGMWAFAIYDPKAGKLVLSRDAFGIKPLYYYQKGKQFAFASELRGLRPVLELFGHTDNVLAHHLYFLFGYIPAPHSPFVEVKKVLPGEVLIYDLATQTLAHSKLVPEVADTPRTLDEALGDSVRAHFVADVPVCLFYSGGIDSTLLLAKARELGFNPEPFFLHIPNRLDNEYAVAAAKELGVKITSFDFSPKQALEPFLSLRESLDEPFADTSYIPTEYLSEQVARTHKVVLSGEGGDEFFGGYHRHNHLLGLQKGMRLVPEALVARLPARLRRAAESKINRDPYAAYLEFVRVDEGLVSRTEALEFLHERVAARDELGLAFDQEVYLPDDLLFKIDRAGMRHGLEGRVPFLDTQFFAAARQHSARERHGGSPSGKGMLKDLLRNYLPEQLVERPKQGFSISLAVLKDVPQEVKQEALAYAQQHAELIPLDPAQALQHPQSAYALLIWTAWHKNFFK